MVRNWLIFHLASGHAFFSGTALVMLAVVISPKADVGLVRRLRILLVIFGGLLVAASATPLPVWAYAALAITTVGWLCLECWKRSERWKHLLVARLAVAALWLVAAGMEAAWHVIPRVPGLEQPVLAVIGDSLTAGLGDNETTWPGLLAERHGVPVRDYSSVGATVASARKQADELGAEENLVLLEIGGNDLLGSTSPEQFAAGLERLLLDVCRPGRTVLMFELPLPPFFNAYGRIQRRLARKHGMLLIPKRVLMGVLVRQDTTLDSIHLSNAGHARMADAVWSIIGEVGRRQEGR
ncbi:MAG: lysophospholipase [Planctomycetes bacterium]|nr:lysophospholipase [Planctomycetota bacterium]